VKNEYNNEILSKLMKVVERHLDCISDFDSILSECSTKLMSKGVDIYGMFFPEKEVIKNIIYKGRLVKNERERHFSYYFDECERLRLTERCSNKAEPSYLIFYYYYKDLTEIVWYSLEDQMISQVGYIEYVERQLIRFVDSYDVRRHLRKNEAFTSFSELLFNVDDEFVVRHSYYSEGLIDGKIMEKRFNYRKK
jgi:hypothetical protein